MSKNHEVIINKVKSLPKKPVVQKHHISYVPERVVYIYKGEHFILTQLQWRKYISQGLIESLKQFIQDYEHLAMPLSYIPPKKKRRKRRGAARSRRTKRKTRKKKR